MNDFFSKDVYNVSKYMLIVNNKKANIHILIVLELKLRTE